MYKNDLLGLTEQEYKELKQYLKMLYDIDNVYLKPLEISNNLIIS